MKNIIILSATFFLLSNLACKKNKTEPPITPAALKKQFGGNGFDNLADFKKMADGGFVLAGTTTSTDGDGTGNHGLSDGLVIRTNATGTIIWKKVYGGTGQDVFNSVVIAPDGNIVVSGYCKSTDGDIIGNHGLYDYVAMKLSSADGAILWSVSYGGTADDYCNGMVQLADGSLLLSGYTNSNNGDILLNRGNGDIWVLKLKNTGDIIWSKTFGGTSFDIGTSIIRLANDEIAVLGYTGSTDGDVTGNHGGPSDVWLLKLSSNGTLMSQKCYGGSGQENPSALVELSDGSVAIAGLTNSTDGDAAGASLGAIDAWVLKTNAAGTVLWQKKYGGSQGEKFDVLTVLPDGSLAAGGYTESNDNNVSGNHGGIDAWYLKLNSASGAIISSKLFGGTGDDYMNRLLPSANKVLKLILTNSNDGDFTTSRGVYDAWLIDLD